MQKETFLADFSELLLVYLHSLRCRRKKRCQLDSDVKKRKLEKIERQNLELQQTEGQTINRNTAIMERYGFSVSFQ